MPLPSYPEIRISLASRTAVSRHIEAAAPDHIHIATEGPIGLAGRVQTFKEYQLQLRSTMRQARWQLNHYCFGAVAQQYRPTDEYVREQRAKKS